MNDFITQAIRTESGAFPLDERKFPEPASDRLLHAAIGMATESGEFLDALKKHLFYGKPLDTVNLIEELGDQLWYIAIAMDALGTDFDTVQQTVINKLKVRYPDKYSDESALNRDLDAEREALEG